jgi:hypothetical protein
MADRIEDVWCAHTWHPRGGDWPARVDEHVVAEPEKVSRFDEKYGGEAWEDLVRAQPATPDSLAFLGDVRALYLAAEAGSIAWVMAAQAAQALRDADLLTPSRDCHTETKLQAKWLTTRVKTGSPQALVVE